MEAAEGVTPSLGLEDDDCMIKIKINFVYCMISNKKI